MYKRNKNILCSGKIKHFLRVVINIKHYKNVSTFYFEWSIKRGIGFDLLLTDLFYLVSGGL